MKLTTKLVGISGCIAVFVVAALGTWKLHADSAEQDKTVYMICDVHDITYNGATVEINVILPNGDLLTQYKSENDDLPEDFNEVVIRTDNLDDYSTYRIVGLR